MKCVPWSVSNEVPTLQLMDIGVYPLPDDEWVKGKSGLKALQYMALGLPVVASNVGCNDRVVLDGETGFLVSSEGSGLIPSPSFYVQPLFDNHLVYQLGSTSSTRFQ